MSTITENQLVVVFGAGGGAGSRCVARLVELGTPVRATVRDTERHKGRFDSRVELVKADVTDPESIKHALVGSSGAIFAASNGGSYWTSATEIDNKVGAASMHADVSRFVDTIANTPDHTHAHFFTCHNG